MARFDSSTRSQVTRPTGLRAAVAATAEILESRTFLAFGDLDPTFGVGGKFVHDAPLIPTALAVQPDGKILFSGWGLGDCASVARLNPDGTADLAFGNTYGRPGIASSNTGDYGAFSTGLALGPNGKIAVSGYTYPYGPQYGTETATVVVYDSQGRTDSAFAGDGSIQTNAYGRFFDGVAFQGDGKVLVVGQKLVRFGADGTPDRSFGGGDGVIDQSGRKVLVDASGKVVVLGYFAVFRYNPDGTPDTTFDGDGVLPNVKGRDIAFASDGDILVAGNGPYGNFVSRFNPDGSVDDAFGNHGNATAPGAALAVTGNDIFVGGDVTTTLPPSGNAAVYALTPTGRPDTTFGQNGQVTPPSDTLVAPLVDMTARDGKLLVLGTAKVIAPGQPDYPETHAGLVQYQVAGAPPADTQQPFGGTPAGLPGTLQLENYDTGGEGVAYHDLDAANVGGVYRTDGADVQSIPAGGYNLGFARAGEWTEYTVNVPQAGNYGFEVRLASLKGGGHFRLEIDGIHLANGTAPNTRDWQKYDVVELGSASVTAGQHVLRLVMDGNDPTGYVANFDSLRVTAHVVPTPQTPFGGTPFTTPGVLQLENFDEGGEGVAYHDTDAVNQGGAYRSTGVDIEAIPASAGGGYALDFAKAGEWTEYTFVVPDLQGASYDPVLRYAAPRGGEIELSIDGVPFASRLTLRNTDGWQDYQLAFPFFDLHIAPGTHVLRLTQLRNGDYGYVANFDSLEFVRYREPYNFTPFNPGETIQAEDFDTGGEGWTYHDADRANLGDSLHRSDDGVDIQTAADAADAFPGLNVGFTKAGEWLEYTINGPDNDGDLLGLEVRVASLRGGGKFHLDADGKTIASFTVPATDSWQTYATLTTPKSIRLAPRTAPGRHTLRLVMDQNDSTGYVANFNWMRFAS